jgi:hypothetical protein
VSPNSPYEVYIYKGVTSDPVSGSLAGTKTGTIAFPGYHTISLDSRIPLTAGQKFSVVVRLTTPGYIYPIPAEQPWADYSSKATANPGESFISNSGSSGSWQDLTSYSWCQECNVCVKAFTAEKITLQSPLEGEICTTCSLVNTHQPSFTWTPSGTFTGFTIFLSTSPTDFTTRGVLITKASVRATTNTWIPSSFVWKKIMTLSSQNGNIYWKVEGTKPDRTNLKSAVWNFQIGTPQPVTINAPPAGPLPGSTPPTFDFNTSCNAKFKLEISSIGDFSDPKKIKSFNYTTRDPNIDQRLIKILSSFQWNSIKKLIGTGTGHFRIKAWDGINRETVSEVRSFTILPSLVGTWDTSGTETLTATYKDGRTRSGTVTYHDEFTFNLDGTFHMRDLSGTWTQQGSVFTINVPFEEVKHFFEQHYFYQGYTVNVTSASTSFTGKENITNDTISGKFIQVVDLSHDYNDVPIKANIDYPFTGQRQQGAQISTLGKSSLKGATSLFDIISKQLSQSGLVK